MKFTLEIKCDNAAFKDDPKNEISRILRDTASRLDGNARSTSGSLFDQNGNRVGTWEITP